MKNTKTNNFNYTEVGPYGPYPKLPTSIHPHMYSTNYNIIVASIPGQSSSIPSRLLEDGE